jgi:hypothetical protein
MTTISDSVLRGVHRLAVHQPEEQWPATVVANLCEELIRLRGTDKAWLAIHPEEVTHGSS